jgi:thiol-disulfide isomerase/thioredoxin
MEKAFAAFGVLLLLLMPLPGLAQEAGCEQADIVSVYFFWRDGCPHCHEETEFLQGLEQKYGEKLEVHYLEAKNNVDLFYQLAEEHGAPTQWVPITFIPCCNWYVIGFDEKIGEEIEGKIKDKLEVPVCEEDQYIIVPIIGKVYLEGISMPLFTVVIAGLDGFNPCAIWVLMFLLSLLIYSKSRKRILLIGGIFVAASAAIYFLFMTAWLNLFLFIGYTDAMRIIIAAIALLFGAINVKDFFAFKKGVSLTISESAKPKLFEKMRRITQAEITAGLIVGTVLLAVFVNLVELACTLGLPAIYTRILTLQNFPPLVYYLYLVIYNIIYVVPLAIIVGVFAFTMGSRKLSEKQGRILKLVSGALMLGLGLIMLLAPELLVFS